MLIHTSSVDMLPSLALILLVPYTIAKDPWFHLRILHVNDMHARFSGVTQKFEPCRESSECYGGYARISRAANSIINDDPHHTIFLNAGDNFQGSALYTQFKSDVVADLLNGMNFDVMALGNHEFDDGVAELNRFLGKINHRVTCANLDLRRDSILTSGGVEIAKWVMVVRNHRRIGIVGYITPYTQYTANVSSVEFRSIITSVRRAAQRAKMQGAQLIIALGHAGYYLDMEIAREVQQVDIVVGGYSETFLYTGASPDPENDVPQGSYPTVVTRPNGKQVPVVQAYKFTKYLGYLSIDFSEDFDIIYMHGNPILMSPELPEDYTITEKHQYWMNELKAYLAVDELVVQIYRASSHKGCKYEECGLGNLMADAMTIDTCEEEQMEELYCVASVYNGGLIRSDVGKGKLTNFGLKEVYPYNNSLHLVEMEGKYVLEMLETSVRWYHETRAHPIGGFLQVSGLNVEYDLQQPPGKRVHSAEIRFGNSHLFTPVEPNKMYKLVVPDKMYRGGYNYTVFADHHINSTILKKTDFAAARSFLRGIGGYPPNTDNRIRFIGITPKEPMKREAITTINRAPFTQITHLFFVLVYVLAVL